MGNSAATDSTVTAAGIPSGRVLTTGERIRAIVASSSGNLVEWYDFYTYAFTAIYFAQAFFPKGDTTTELLQAAAIFAVGFLMRPIGSWFFGRYADRHGRKRSLVFAVLLMCAGSLMIAILPTYAQAGIVAPALLLLARMIQGFSVGGEYGTTATYMSEVAAQNNRGFLSSFQYVTLVGGQLMASLVLVIHLQVLSKDQMQAWGWRLPFALGAVLAIVALYLRASLHETADLSSHRKEAGTFGELFRYKKPLLIVLGYTAGGSLAFYAFTTYMQKYLVNTAKFDKDTATYVMTAVLFVYMIVQPLFGALSDRIGRRNNMLLFCILGMLATVPIMTAIGETKSPQIAFLLATGALLIVSFYTSIAGIVKAELFPAHIRALGVGLSYAIANSLFGGSAEFVALKLKQIGWESAFFWYVTAMLGLALIATLAMPDTRKGSLMDRD